MQGVGAPADDAIRKLPLDVSTFLKEQGKVGQHIFSAHVPVSAGNLQIGELHQLYAGGKLTPAKLLEAIFTSQAYAVCLQEKNVFISPVTKEDALQYVKQNLDTISEKDWEAKLRKYPLYGVPFVVKDNIDVAGLPTSIGIRLLIEKNEVCAKNAACVEALLNAGAICLGKVNLDQLATGLIGTRSPFGKCVNSFSRQHVSGGSSSGSAVAVAHGICSFSLGTDTAGSGRVPASLNNIVGLKPSIGAVDIEGVVPACKSLDCVCIFALSCADATSVLSVLLSESRDINITKKLEAKILRPPLYGHIPRSSFAKKNFKFGVPGVWNESTKRYEQCLQSFFLKKNAESTFTKLFDYGCELLQTLGGQPVVIPYAPLDETARLLYQGPWVAERLAVLEDLYKKYPELKTLAPEKGGVLPVTRGIIENGLKYAATDVYRAYYRLEELRTEVDKAIWGQGVDFIMLPTCPAAWTFQEEEKDPVGTNSKNGYYTNFMNLLDMCGVAVPFGFLPADEKTWMPCGGTLFAPAGCDAFLLDVGARVQTASQLRVGRTGEALFPQQVSKM